MAPDRAAIRRALRTLNAPEHPQRAPRPLHELVADELRTPTRRQRPTPHRRRP